MRRYTLRRFDIVWLALILASLAAWEISPGPSKGHNLIIGQINIALGFIKAWLIGWEFMELRSAPRLLQALLGAWAGLVGAAIVVLYSI